jgi:hypothetical protein
LRQITYNVVVYVKLRLCERGISNGNSVGSKNAISLNLS